MDYVNVNYNKKFTLSFMLETNISNSDYIRIYYPFLLHNSATNSVPANLQAFYTTSSTEDCSISDE